MSKARAIVAKLLEFDFSDEPESRPGGPKDPLRQVTMQVDTDKFDYSGKRSTEPKASEDDEGEEKKKPAKPNRFNINFESLNQVRRVIKRPVKAFEDVCPHCEEVIREKSTYSESLDAPLRHSCGGAIEFEPVDPETVVPWLRRYLK